MSNILDRYGIKEVADVTFYSINADGSPKVPVLYLDTLKVTTIEQTAEETEARGGKGNAALIAWDYGKEINVTIEDALFSAKSMAIMFGNGTVTAYSDGAYIMKTEQFTASANASGNTPTAAGWSQYYIGPDGKKYTKQNPKFYTATGEPTTTFVGPVTEANGTITTHTYFCSYDLKVDGAVIEISANSFPGTYYVTGDTFARAEATGDDEFFQFIIPKAKVQSENTITLEAEGDPSVFNMNLKVLRPADGVMMKLVKYNLVEGSTADSTSSTMYHNHYLDPASASGGYTISGTGTLKIANPTAAGEEEVSWMTTNSDIATVAAGTDTDAGNGIVTGVGAGTVSVLATWDGGYAVYDVTVTA